MGHYSINNVSPIKSIMKVPAANKFPYLDVTRLLLQLTREIPLLNYTLDVL